MSHANRTPASQITLDTLAFENKGHRAVAAEDPAQGDQVIDCVGVGQRGLMPGVGQDGGPGLCARIGAICDGIVILRPRAAGLGCAPEILHRRAEGSGFLGEDAVGDEDKVGQWEPVRRPYGHSPMMTDGCR
jgi:hypothetical protein